MQQQSWFQSRQFRLSRPPSWQLWLLLAFASALGVAVAIVATGVFIIAVPLTILAFLGYRAWSALARTPRRRAGPVVIEGDYEIVRRGPNTSPSRDENPRGRNSPWRE